MGVIVGKIIFWLILLSFAWGIYKLWKSILNGIFPNPTKKLLQEYLFWIDFAQGITSIKEFKKRLLKIKNKKVYKNKFNQFYLTQEEANAFNENIEVLNMKDVLKSETYPLFLLSRLERLTLYTKDDLKNITKSSQMLWLFMGDIIFHLILKDNKILYPLDYPMDNQYRFGYEILYSKTGKLGVYDIKKDILILPIKYKSISILGNLVEVSKDNKIFKIIDLRNNETLQKNQEKVFPNISQKLKEKIDLSKIELKDFMSIVLIPKTQNDLVSLGLWNAKVGVIKVPSHYEDIIEDSTSGCICWSYPISADIFDMSIELPVIFQKKNGEDITLGIEFKYLILETEYRKKLRRVSTQDNENSSHIGRLDSFQDLLKRGNLPDDDRDVPLWLQIKNETYKTIPTTKKIINDIVSLDNDEFMQYINRTINQNIFFTALSCAKNEELELLYKYLEKKQNGLTTEFKNNIQNFKDKNIKKEQLDFALMVVSLYAIEAKNTFSKFIRLYSDMNQSNFSKDDESLFELEYSINALFYHSNNNLYTEFKEFISTIRELFDSKKISNEFCTHIASKFAPILHSIDKSFQSEYTNLEYDLKWFIANFIQDEIEILKDESILHQLMLLHCARLQSIEEKKLEVYFDHTITLTRYYLAYSPYLKENALYYLSEIMDFVAEKELTIDNANAFIEVFKVLPALYEETSYENIMAFKELINRKLSTSKPQDNKIFDKKGVKNKLIILNYLVDMEDLYYKSGKNK